MVCEHEGAGPSSSLRFLFGPPGPTPLAPASVVEAAEALSRMGNGGLDVMLS